MTQQGNETAEGQCAKSELKTQALKLDIFIM